MKNILRAALVVIICVINVNSARANAPIWRQVNAAGFLPQHEFVAVGKYQVYQLQYDNLKQKMTLAGKDAEQGVFISIPDDQGRLQPFKVWKNNILSAELAQKYPELLTFDGYNIHQPSMTTKIDFSPKGLHIVVYQQGKTLYIDPVKESNEDHYYLYEKNDYIRETGNTMNCEVMTQENQEEISPMDGKSYRWSYGDKRITYRLAVACTGEYSVAVAGSNPQKADVFSTIVTTINRVNGIYERELATTFTLVTDTLIFLNASTDPFDNNNADSLIEQSQRVIDTMLGNEKYDIGHTFSTGGGGLAGIGVVCDNRLKANGITGSPEPYGDRYDVDYVAHEIGHQMGSEHTFNSKKGSCYGNGVHQLAYEPGSGSTIMAYAAICLSDNIQLFSDDYFHLGSKQVITENILSGIGSTCGQRVDAPISITVPAINNTYHIPINTPFELRFLEDDAQDTNALYLWEQFDLGNFGAVEINGSKYTSGPTLRSYTPSSAKNRIIPQLENVLSGNLSSLGERMSHVGRTYNFQLTKYHFQDNWGVVAYTDSPLVVNVIATKDSFYVSSPQKNETLVAKTEMTVQWNVASTHLTPINCNSVSIYLSLDGGYTYPVVLAKSVANIGKAKVVLPPAITDSARIKVTADNNIFFAVNNGNFAIKASNAIPDISLGNWEIYPNPAEDYITIAHHGTKASDASQYVLTNTLGQVVREGNLDQAKTTITVKGLAKSVYYLSILNNGKYLGQQKIVIK